MFPPLLCLVFLFSLLLCFPLGVFPLPVLVLKERLYLQEQDAGKGLYEQKAESILLTLLYKERGVLPFYGRYEVCCMEACFVKE